MLVPITTLDDPRIGLYRGLKDRDLARDGARFIAESEPVVRRLLASDYPTESVLVTERKAEELAAVTPTDVPVYVAPAQLVNRIVGFKFHSGVMAIGRRRSDCTLQTLLAGNAQQRTLVICPQTNNPENVGAMIRISAAFGAVAFPILGPNCCDPFYRQSIRVSMGTIFSLPLMQSGNLESDLRCLRDQHGFELAATVLDDAAEPLSKAIRGDRLALLFGSEGQGLDAQWIDLCQRRITIPMSLGTDSLNVSVAAAVFLYHFTQRQDLGSGV